MKHEANRLPLFNPSGHQKAFDNYSQVRDAGQEKIKTALIILSLILFHSVFMTVSFRPLQSLIFQGPETKEKQIKAADCFLTLGEVSLESEAYDAAVDDFNRCLEIQKKHLTDDDRYIAETHYQLGLTHSFAKNYSEARMHFRHAIKVRIGCLPSCRVFSTCYDLVMV